MKVNVYVVDLEIPTRVKKWGLRFAIPVTILTIGGVALAGLPGGYADGQPLTAAVLTNNFNYLQSEVAALQTANVANGLSISQNCDFHGDFNTCSCATGQTAIAAGGICAGNGDMVSDNLELTDISKWDMNCQSGGNPVAANGMFVVCVNSTLTLSPSP